MPKLKGGMGAGSMAMGGGGKKPSVPPTPFGGPAPQSGAMMGVQPRGGGMGPRAAPGAGVKAFAKGGGVKGSGAHDDEAQDRKLFKKMEKEEGAKEKKPNAYAHGGPVIAGHGTHGMRGAEHPKEEGISRGSDMRRSAGPKGSDSRVHRPHSGKAS